MINEINIKLPFKNNNSIVKYLEEQECVEGKDFYQLKKIDKHHYQASNGKIVVITENDIIWE